MTVMSTKKSTLTTAVTRVHVTYDHHGDNSEASKTKEDAEYELFWGDAWRIG